MKQALIILSSALVLSACAGYQEDKELDQEEEMAVELESVPAAVIAAAEAALPGIIFDEAEYEEEDGLMVYELEGMLGAARYEIEVTPEGEVIEVEEVEAEEIEVEEIDD